MSHGFTVIFTIILLFLSFILFTFLVAFCVLWRPPGTQYRRRKEAKFHTLMMPFRRLKLQGLEELVRPECTRSLWIRVCCDIWSTAKMNMGHDDGDNGVDVDILKDMDLYLAAKNGDLSDFRRALDRISAAENVSTEHILDRVTPAGSTLAHVAAKHGNKAVLYHIAANFPHLIFEKNRDGDTVLHLVSGSGNLSMVKALVPDLQDLQYLPCGSTYIAVRNKLVRKRNRRANTALHEALLYGRESVARYLIQQDPEISYYQNRKLESAFYLAAKAGFVPCVSSILQLCTDDQEGTYADQLKENSPIHAAIKNKNKDVLEAILNGKPSLITLKDGLGRTPLHFAVSSGYLEGVRYLLGINASISLERDESGSYPIHHASVIGHNAIIKLLLQYCPAPEELIDNYGRNILHVAALHGRANLVRSILNNPNYEKLINMKDFDGNTALHLATMDWLPFTVTALTWNKKLDTSSVNDKGLTALDVAVLGIESNRPFHQRLTWMALLAAGIPKSHHLKGVSTISTSFVVEYVYGKTNTLLLVSTLIATVTFAAGFTMPGGYDYPQNPGMATLLKKKGFHIFVICNTIAMHCSMIVDVAIIFAHFGGANMVNAAIIWTLPFLGIALSTMSIAFTAGILVVISKLEWLSVCIGVIGLAFQMILLILLIILFLPYHSKNRILRYLSHYPYRLLVFTYYTARISRQV